MIQNDAELDELLSRPSEQDVAAAAALNGDLVILGVGGKMGPTLALRARRAVEASGRKSRVIAVARFSNSALLDQFESAGIEAIREDLLEPGALGRLPDAPNIIFMAAMKFGTTGAEHLTWAMNTFLPGLVAERYRNSRIVAFSTGNVYPLVPIESGGATEDTPVAPVGEYAQSALGRERMFEYGSHKYGTPVAILRLNYAVETRYGVLADIARKVFERRPVDVTMGYVNVIWQGDANSVCFRCLAHCASPPLVVNLTGAQTISVRWLATEFARRFKIDSIIHGQEANTALLNNSSRMVAAFGPPSVAIDQMIDWTAEWIRSGGGSLGKPTHFETRDGRF
jgi:nucleoside-diphosphate-sugar epimerase